MLSVRIGTAPTPPSVVAGNPKTNDFTSYGVLDDSASDGQFLSGFGGGVAPEMEVDAFDEFEGASTLVAEFESEWYAEDAGSQTLDEIANLPEHNGMDMADYTTSDQPMQAEAGTGDGSMTYADSMTTVSEESAPTMPGREHAVPYGQGAVLQAVDWESTIIEVMAADAWAVADLQTSGGPSLVAEEFDPTLTEG